MTRNRRQEFLTHLAARSLYRADAPAMASQESWKHWTLPAGDDWTGEGSIQAQGNQTSDPSSPPRSQSE